MEKMTGTQEEKIKYVQLEPAAFLSDIDFQMMDAEQRGIYCSIIFYLYCNGGKLDLNSNNDITLLDNKYSKIAMLSNCRKTGSQWQELWSKIAHKFQINGNILTHNRVSKELSKSKKLREAKSRAGKRGMKSRYSDNRDITKVREGKVSKGNKDKESNKEKEPQTHFPLPPDKKIFVDIAWRIGLTNEEAELAYANLKANNWKRANQIPIESWDQMEGALTYWKLNRGKFDKKQDKKTIDDQLAQIRQENKT